MRCGTEGGCRSYKQRRRYDYIPFVVHSFRGLLASGSARITALSVDLAALIAVPHCRDRRGRSAGVGKGDHLSACPCTARPSLTHFRHKAGDPLQQGCEEADSRAESMLQGLEEFRVELRCPAVFSEATEMKWRALDQFRTLVLKITAM